MKTAALRTCLVLLVSAVAPLRGDVVELPAARDNTLYEDSNGETSNGAGQRFFAGTTGALTGGEIRRGVLAFDVAESVPAGATVTHVELRLHMSRTISSNQPVSLHRMQADWGEGPSNAPGEEGGGTQAQSGDATWLHRFYDTELWDQPGGDFAQEASAVVQVGGNGFYTWSSDEMVEDVQAWIDDPDSDFGWLVRGNEGAQATAKRFDSRHASNADVRPLLTVEYTVSEAPEPPRITGARWVETGFEVTFVPTPGRLHTIETSETLDPESWQPHTTGIEDDGDAVTVVDTTADEAGRRFYRVRLEP